MSQMYALHGRTQKLGKGTLTHFYVFTSHLTKITLSNGSKKAKEVLKTVYEITVRMASRTLLPLVSPGLTRIRKQDREQEMSKNNQISRIESTAERCQGYTRVKSTHAT